MESGQNNSSCGTPFPKFPDCKKLLIKKKQLLKLWFWNALLHCYLWGLSSCTPQEAWYKNRVLYFQTLIWLCISREYICALFERCHIYLERQSVRFHWKSISKNGEKSLLLLLNFHFQSNFKTYILSFCPKETMQNYFPFFSSVRVSGFLLLCLPLQKWPFFAFSIALPLFLFFFSSKDISSHFSANQCLFHNLSSPSHSTDLWEILPEANDETNKQIRQRL